MTTHTKLQKEFIVKRLAAFANANDIILEFAKLFPGTVCTPADVAANNPRESIIDPDLHALFRSEREQNIIDPERCLFGQQAARLFALSALAERLFANNQPHDARSVLRQIAEEQGMVGGKSGRVDPAVPPGEKVTEITRTIIDPAAPSAGA